MRHIAKALLAGSLFATTLTFVSCNKSKKYDLETITSQSLQLRGFGISSTENKVLATHFFNITNTEGEGTIVNSIPLAYGTKLKKVAFTLGIDNTTSKIQIAIGNGAYEDWVSTKTHDIADDVRSIKVKLTSADGKHSYVYNVQLLQYNYDPEMIDWTKGDSHTAQLFPSGSYSASVPLSTAGHFLVVDARTTGNTFYTMQWSGSAFPRTYLASSLTPVSYTGIPLGEQVLGLEHFDTQEYYALTNAKKVYRLNGTTWEDLGLSNAIALLGVLPARTSTNGTTLALVVRDGADLRYASYRSGKLTTSTETLPTELANAYTSGKIWHYSYSTNATYIGPSLRMIVVRQGATATQTTRETWFTTNGITWGAVHSKPSETPPAQDVEILNVDNTLYILETTTTGLDVHTSTDNGASWTKSKDIALTNLELSEIRNANITAWTIDNAIYLLRGVGTGGYSTALVLRGIPLKKNV